MKNNQGATRFQVGRWHFYENPTKLLVHFFSYAYVRTLFVDFSSAFNTIQPHILFPKLTELNVPNSLCLWILDFLTQRPQFVSLKLKHGCFQSSELVTNTGAPQGTVLAPILFSIYTNSCVQTFENIPIIKYADDTSIQALIKSTDDVSNYFSGAYNLHKL